jgi:hypothetical protein
MSFRKLSHGVASNQEYLMKKGQGTKEIKKLGLKPNTVTKPEAKPMVRKSSGSVIAA